MKNISILGATGSIGLQSLSVIKNNKEIFSLDAISIGENLNCLRKILKDHTPKLICVKNKHDYETLKGEYPNLNFTYGEEGLLEVSSFKSSHTIINGLVGIMGLIPTICAIKEGKDIALANKETLVTGGHIINKLIKEHNVNLIPVDSEHSAIFQCLNGENKKDIKRLILTASGGSFRDKKRSELKNVTLEDALKHPNWSMGHKITIDSATMVNKGLEIIEAHFLFDIPYENIDVILHRESIIHSMVEFLDTSIIAQLGTPNMCLPIQYALTYPKRIPNKTFDTLDLTKIASLNFNEIDFERYPCVKMAYDAGIMGGTSTTVFNSSNEESVKMFLNKEISFLDIEHLIESSLNKFKTIKEPTIDTILQTDKEVRAFVRDYIKK